MNTTNITDLVFTRLSDTDFIDLINQFTPIKNEQLLLLIEKELNQRNFNYQHLINSNNEFKLQQPLRLIDGNLFELNIPKPPMVGTFYKNVKQLIDFLKNNPYLQNKKLVTFDYILDQFYASTNDVEIIEENQLKNLSNNCVFIGFKNNSQTFPNESVLKQIAHLNTFVLINKGDYYRGLKEAYIYQNNEIAAHWEPNKIKDID